MTEKDHANQGRHTCHTPDHSASNEALLSEASERTAIEDGFRNAADVYAAQIGTWRWRIEALPPPATATTAKIKAAALEFLAGRWALTGVRAGWTELELFGCDPFAQGIRVDAMGVVSAIALSNLRADLSDINAEAAVSWPLRAGFSGVTG